MVVLLLAYGLMLMIFIMEGFLDFYDCSLVGLWPSLLILFCFLIKSSVFILKNSRYSNLNHNAHLCNHKIKLEYIQQTTIVLTMDESTHI